MQTISVLLSAGLAAVVLGQTCVYHDSATHSSFDLRPLTVGVNSYYTVKDAVDTFERNYTYNFNVCNDAAVPDGCGETEAGAGPAPAFQVYDGGQCFRLGNSFENVRYDLLDADDPTQGVQLTYLRGDICHLDTDIERTMTIKMRCSESWGLVPDARVVEETCHYELMFETIYGCPLECPQVNRKLCGGNGFCGMDLDSNAPRCFCNAGHSGADCTTEQAMAKACGGTCGALIFVIILLCGLLLAGAVIFYRVQKLSELNVKFGEMTQKLTRGARSDSFA